MIMLIGLTRKLADVSHSDLKQLHNLYIYAMLNPRGSVIAGGRVYSPDSTALGGGFRVEASGWGRNAKEEEEEENNPFVHAAWRCNIVARHAADLSSLCVISIKRSTLCTVASCVCTIYQYP